uniref:proline-rich protein HaeIII subfamily 1-like n=1 Tax=Panthera onca TaxID=9690 RepID=UPI00295377F7|nr:proline-rich protein HaeIII subfamily 1-like [Panthera onca]
MTYKFFPHFGLLDSMTIPGRYRFPALIGKNFLSWPPYSIQFPAPPISERLPLSNPGSRSPSHLRENSHLSPPSLASRGGGGVGEWRERDTSGQAQPQPQQQPPRRHGGARHKERYGDPPRLPPPPGRVAGPRGHPSPPPRTRSARTAGHGAEGGRRGAEEPQGSGARPRGMGRDPGPRGGWQSGVCSGPPPQPLSPSRAAETPAFGERRRGAAPGGLGPRRPCPPAGLSLPPPGTRSPPPSPRFGFLSYSSPPLLSSRSRRTPLLAPAVSLWPPALRDPRKADRNSPEAGTPPGPSLLAPPRLSAPPPCPPPAARHLPSQPRGEPRGAREGPLALLRTVFPPRPPLGAKNKQAASDLQKP